MSNPADQTSKASEHFFIAKNGGGLDQLDSVLRMGTEGKIFDAMVTKLDPEFENRYEVTIYLDGLHGSSSIQIKGVPALTLDPSHIYDLYHPARVSYDGKIAWLMPSFHLWAVNVMAIPDVATPNRVKIRPYAIGMPGSPTVLDDDEDEVETDLYFGYGFANYSYSSTGSNTGLFYKQPPPPWPEDYLYVTFLAFRLPTPMQMRDTHSETGVESNARIDGIILTGGGIKLPRPGNKYDVLTIVDDAGTIGWDTWRFP